MDKKKNCYHYHQISIFYHTCEWRTPPFLSPSSSLSFIRQLILKLSLMSRWVTDKRCNKKRKFSTSFECFCRGVYRISKCDWVDIAKLWEWYQFTLIKVICDNKKKFHFKLNLHENFYTQKSHLKNFLILLNLHPTIALSCFLLLSHFKQKLV